MRVCPVCAMQGPLLSPCVGKKSPSASLAPLGTEQELWHLVALGPCPMPALSFHPQAAKEDTLGSKHHLTSISVASPGPGYPEFLLYSKKPFLPSSSITPSSSHLSMSNVSISPIPPSSSHAFILHPYIFLVSLISPSPKEQVIG